MILIFYKILIGTTLVGITTGIVGCFTMLNKQSLLGDTIAHATLPGLTGMFLLILEKSYMMLLLGAGISGLLGAFTTNYIIKNSCIKKDAALGIVLSTFFGLGIIFLTILQKLPVAHQAGIDKFLFGQAATLLDEDIIVIAVLSCIVIITTMTLWKEFKILTFDPIYAKSIGLPIEKYQNILLLMIVITVIIGLQTVGLILMSSFLIAPAAAARQWTDRLSTTLFLSIIFSLLATTSGTIISYQYAHIPTGPAIVIIATLITFASMFICSLRK